MIKLSDIKRFWEFYKGADTKYNLHSPFVFDFISNVLDTEKEYYPFEDIEIIRKKLLGIDKEVEFQDYGAGSRIDNNSSRKIKDIAKTSSIQPKDGRILYNLVIHFKPKTIVELGTSLGIGSMYLASADSKSHLITVEGNPGSAYIARRNFDLMGLKNIHLIEGQFDDILPNLLNETDQIDLAYIDGNHQKEATERYFSMFLEKIHAGSVIVLDDIYWSDGMLSAWKHIISHPRVTMSIDIYTKGFVFFNQSFKTKQHFKYIATKYKPWKFGLKA